MPSNRSADEETPLLSSPSTPNLRARPVMSRWHQHLAADVSRDWADCILILCYLITGLLDSASISVWGSFVSMQTGNTVYLGLGLASPATSTRWIKSGASLLAFCIGSFLFSRFHRLFSPKRRWVLAASFTAQMAITAVAAGLVTATATADRDRNKDLESLGWEVLVPIALVAFQSCGQAVVSRALGYNALTSVVLTSIYCDLFSDAELFALRNVERNRRTGAPVFLLVGAIVGGKLVETSWGVAGVLWAAAVLKAGVVVVWLVWPAEKSVEESLGR
ncbi:hypothetical protein C8A01DRAFT_16327 [Parachaetomium inaequale]|uniref:DUF1275 domain protein n=1 Tax=Parachaetomium inaequale TaxID=2588326 RepID=A0AAN6PFL2_9PEZI|nr:hypothetical protein C8A01DRAFT_16327 [Parachaetomium inaequale]